jgi:dolichyldiphosphatase
LLRVRDLLVNEDLAEPGWQRWEAKRLEQRQNAVRKSQ